MNEGVNEEERVRRYLGRLLGWADGAAIENALRAVRLAFEDRGELSLRGPLDLQRVALALHRLHGADRPFVCWDPERREPKASVRSVESRAHLVEAIAAATGGTLCVARRGAKFWGLQAALRSADLALVYFLEARDQDRTVRPGPVNIPALDTRSDDVPRIIDECLADCAGEMSWSDRAWLRGLAGLDVVAIEKHVTRVVALRAAQTMEEAARTLGITSISLIRWVDRRPAPRTPWFSGAAG